MTGRRKNKRETSKSSIAKKSNTSSDHIDSWLEELEKEYENKLFKLDNLLKKKIAEIDCVYDLIIRKTPSHILNSKIRWVNKQNIESTITETTQRIEKGTMSHQTRQGCSSASSSDLPSPVCPLTSTSSFNTCRKMPKQLTATAKKFRTPALRSCVPSIPSFITPKVMLNAPLSIARYPQDGEVAVSLQGSPLMVTPLVQNYRANTNISLPDGKVLSILPEEGLQSRDIPSLDEETKLELLTLRQHIDAFINMSTNVK